MGRLIKRIIKWAPIIYPIVRKVLNKRKQQKHTNPGSPRS